MDSFDIHSAPEGTGFSDSERDLERALRPSQFDEIGRAHV